jgi:hypothetical protein
MENFNSSKLEIEYNSRRKEFSLNTYDKYGHYVDTIIMDKDEMEELYNWLKGVKWF